MRRIERLTIPGKPSDAPGERDNGKTFVLTEMDAYRGQDWATRALLALASSGLELPDGATEAGMAGLAASGLRALLRLPPHLAKDLKDELLTCATYEHKPGAPLQAIVTGPGCQIEELKTFGQLYLALVELHVGFSLAALSLTSDRTPPTAAA